MTCWIEFTGCCALGHLRFREDMKKRDLEKLLRYYREEFLGDREWAPDKGLGGAPTLFAVITPRERDKGLDKILTSCGFTFIRQIPRRNGYPPGRLDFYLNTLEF